ncbi:MAG TPA: tetratricopeptide repeat protein 38 family protein [Rhodobiaceae bacterium]|nr:tetratricopeptide repeat protein 38 family protein [Rhodobiaceae bacterium]
MQKDQYGNPLTTSSVKARDAYVRGLECNLAATPGAEEAFQEAVAEDENFALAHLAIARNRQVEGRGVSGREPYAAAKACAEGLSSREQGHLAIIGSLLEGKSEGVYAQAKAHLQEFPRDVMIAQACLGVFSLIGFGGQPGREAENLALSSMLAPHYGDDWWFLSTHAFSQMEAGQLQPAARSIERSLAINPRNANGSHHRAHLYYELGETTAGLAYLKDWIKDYDRQGVMHCHLSWHIALWALAAGDVKTMWEVADTAIDPKTSSGPALNIVTDMPALLYRAELAGVEVAPERWQAISEYATARFAKPRLAFADVHAALAHAMAGNAEGVATIVEKANGPAEDFVRSLAEAFQAIAKQDWQLTTEHLTKSMSDHARIGGSRAQRDLIELAMASALARQGKSDEAAMLLHCRRPIAMGAAAQTISN